MSKFSITATMLLVVSLSLVAHADDDRDAPRDRDTPRDADRQSRQDSGDRPFMPRFFAMVDKNHDGQLSQSEMDLAVAVLRTLDEDQNGSVSVGEFLGPRSLKDSPQRANRLRDGDRPQTRDSEKRPESNRRESDRPNADSDSDRPRIGQRDGDPARAAMSPEGMMRSLDKDRDGKISRQEAPERLKRGFDRIDTNGDGKLDGAELGQLRDKLSEAMRSRDNRTRGAESRQDIGGQRPKRPE